MAWGRWTKRVTLALALGGGLGPGMGLDLGLAEQGKPIALTSRVETGFTSNANERPNGVGSLYVRHAETLILTYEEGDVALRGSLGLEQLRFRAAPIMDADTIILDLAAGRQVTPSLMLRGSLKLETVSAGEELAFAGLYLPSRTPSHQLHVLGEALYEIGDQRWRLALGAGQTRFDETRFVDLPLPAVRLNAETSHVLASLDLRQAISAEASWLAGWSGQWLSVSEADQLDLARIPIHRMRGSTGLALQVTPAVGLVAQVGVDWLWSDRLPALRRSLPFAGLEAEIALGEALAVVVSAASGTDVVDAADGLASRTQTLSATFNAALGPQSLVSLGVNQQWRSGVYGSDIASEDLIYLLSMEHQFSPHLRAGVTLSAQEHREAFNNYTKNGLALILVGKL